MEKSEIDHLLDEANTLGVKMHVLGGQLRYRTTKSALTEQFRAKLHGSRRELIAALSGPDFYPREEQGTVPVLQYSRVLVERIRSGAWGVDFSNATHSVLRYHGHLDLDAFRASIACLVSRCRILSARVINTPAGPQFTFDQQRNISLKVEDLSGVESDDIEARAIRKAHELVWAPLDIDAGPLFRVFAIKLRDAEYLVGFVVHHFICDFTSCTIVIVEILQEYMRQRGQPVAAPVRAHLQYADYVITMNDWIRGAGARRRLAHWKRTLAGAKPTRIPPDVDNRASSVAEVCREPFHLGVEQTRALQRLSREKAVTPFEVVLATKIVALSRALASPDVTVIAMLSGRDDPRLNDMIGLVTTRVALRVPVAVNMTFAALLSLVHEVCSEAYANQVPYPLVEELLSASGAATVFPMINFMDADVFEQATQGAHSQWNRIYLQSPVIMGTAQQFASHSMTLSRTASGIHGFLGYSSLLYKRKTICDFLSNLLQLLKDVLRDPDARLHSLAEPADACAP